MVAFAAGPEQTSDFRVLTDSTPRTVVAAINAPLVEEKRSRLIIAPGELSFQFSRPFPSAWHRFWYRVLLGWEWERIDER